MTDGAIDNEYDDAELSAREQLERSVADTQREPVEGGLAVDLVTRQPLFVRRKVAETCAEYYEQEGFNLLEYKTHPWLPVRVDDAVYECAYLDGNPEQAWKFSRTYSFPRGRLMTIPVWRAWEGEDGA